MKCSSGRLFYARWEMCLEKRNHDVQYCVRLRHMLYLLGEVTYIKKHKLRIGDKDKEKDIVKQKNIA